MNQQGIFTEDIKKIINLDFSIMPKYLICIDEISENDLAGRLYCGCLLEGKPFNCAEQLLLSLDAIMDLIKLPQSTMEKKSFTKQKKLNDEPPLAKISTDVQDAMKKYEPDTDTGKKATFVLQVQFRQNASWQGTVKSVETDETIPFRSALQMIKIIADISARGENDNNHG